MKAKSTVLTNHAQIEDQRLLWPAATEFGACFDEQDFAGCFVLYFLHACPQATLP